MSGTANTDLGRYRALYDLTGKVALVVGAGRGIGQASAHALAAAGAEVYCADTDVESAEEAADSIVTQGGKASPLRLDLLDPASVRTALAQVPDLQILVSTPGINVRKAILNTTDDEVDRVLALNLGGFYRLVREAGRIIGFSSIRGTLVEPGQGIYAATKAGTTQILRALAAELGPQGVRANAIAPGATETPLTEQIKQDHRWYEAYAAKSVFARWGQASEIAAAVVFLAADASSFVTGSVLAVDGGWTAVDGRFEPNLG